MAEGALRGTRLGATSYETDDHVEFAARQLVTYDCPAGHSITMPFSVEAEIPAVWECRCGAEALLRDGEAPEPKVVKHTRTHWDMLLERRSLDELQEVLDERLDILRASRGVTPSRRKSA
jgi:hypothetical protein